MSLLTTLAYAITAAVRPRVRDAEVAALKAQVDDLRRDFNETLPHVERQRDDWQALAMEYRDALFRRPAPSQQASAQQLAMQNHYSVLGQQYGMQNFGQQLEDYVRNCTPGRHELFVRD